MGYFLLQQLSRFEGHFPQTIHGDNLSIGRLAHPNVHNLSVIAEYSFQDTIIVKQEKPVYL